jgi:galactarate dehydratase
MTDPITPRTIRMHAADNVAIVANDLGLPKGTLLASGQVLAEHVPQGHKVALRAIAKDEAVRRYNVPIGHALQDMAAGRWVHERLLQMPGARDLQGLPMATVAAPVQAPLTGYTFEGYRNADGSVDVIFGPVKPAGATNWIQTTPGKGWFAYFRFYGPTEAYFAKTWQLNDITLIQP